MNPGLYLPLVAFAINFDCMDNITEIKNHTFLRHPVHYKTINFLILLYAFCLEQGWMSAGGNFPGGDRWIPAFPQLLLLYCTIVSDILLHYTATAVTIRYNTWKVPTTSTALLHYTAIAVTISYTGLEGAT